MFKIRYCSHLIVSALILPAVLLCRTALAAEDGATIAQKIYDRDDGRDSSMDADMVLVEKDGSEKTRTLETMTKDYGKLSKVYIRFTSPQMIRNTAFLSWENDGRDDDQFLYLPSLGRVRRVVSGQKDKAFVNTDFTYEDLERRRPERDVHTVTGAEKFLGYDCTIVESVPKDSDDSQYGKVVAWVPNGIYLPLKVDYYNKKMKLIKRFEVQELKQVDGIWTAMKSTMTDLENEHTTRTLVKQMRYNKGIPDDVFSTEHLEYAE